MNDAKVVKFPFKPRSFEFVKFLRDPLKRNANYRVCKQE